MKKQLIKTVVSLSHSYIIIILMVLSTPLIAQQKTIQLYKGVPPGSENWNWKEGKAVNPMGDTILYNVTRPTLEVYAPVKPNGTAVIVCPGGGLQVLGYQHEGTRIAKEFNEKGITVFFFKYRVKQSFTDTPWQETLKNLRDTSAFQKSKVVQIRDMAFNDLSIAMTYLRGHANEFSLDINRLGMIGFSAGANMVARFCMECKPELSPKFAGVIYSGNEPISKVPPGAPPIFIACAAEDTMAANEGLKLYAAWREANHPAELHIYGKGGHGLKISPNNTWIFRFEEWLKAQGFVD